MKTVGSALPESSFVSGDLVRGSSVSHVASLDCGLGLLLLLLLPLATCVSCGWSEEYSAMLNTW